MSQNLIRKNTLGSEFRSMTRLFHVSLNGNRLYSLTKNSFTSLKDNTYFTQLNLARTHLRVIEAHAFLPLKSLQILTLTDNRLNANMLEQAFYGLRFSYNLTSLRLEGSNLSDINSNTFQYLVNTSITRLNAKGSLLTILPSGSFKCLPRLHTLDLSGNKINKIQRNAFENLNNLNYLHLSRNRLTTIPNGDYVGLQTLKHLDLGRNIISGPISPNSLKGYDQLQSLYLYGNNIRGLSGRAFVHMPCLRRLYLSENRITYFPKDVFYGLENLVTLDLQSNTMHQFDVNIFSYTPSLQKLDLSRNSFISSLVQDDIAFMFRPLRNLTKLLLTSTDLQFLPDSTFHNLTELSIVTLSNNRLTEWSPGLFRDQSKLKILSLARNKISMIHEDAIEQ